jgi:hypothetical protein
MGEVIDLPRIEEACCCNLCDGQDFSIVDDRTEGMIVVCDSCSAVIGKLVVPWMENNSKG